MLTQEDKKLLERARKIANASNNTTKIGAVLWFHGSWMEGNNDILALDGDHEGAMADRGKKLLTVEHAERRLIYSMAMGNLSTQGATLYTTHYPCAECARAIVLSGIARLVVGTQNDGYESRWSDSMKTAAEILVHNDVEIVLEENEPKMVRCDDGAPEWCVFAPCLMMWFRCKSQAKRVAAQSGGVISRRSELDPRLSPNACEVDS